MLRVGLPEQVEGTIALPLSKGLYGPVVHVDDVGQIVLVSMARRGWGGQGQGLAREGQMNIGGAATEHRALGRPERGRTALDVGSEGSHGS